MDKIVDFFKTFENIQKPQKWDNTGILIDCQNDNNKYLLTIDATELVIDECIRKDIKNIVAYHPFIFVPLKTIPSKYVRAIKNDISVFSIHTCLDLAMCLNLTNILNLGEVESFDTFVVAHNSKHNYSYFLEKCKEYISESAMRYVMSYEHNNDSIFDKIIIGVGASQQEFKEYAKNALIITGEMSHHDMLYYQANGVSVILMEHSNIERIYMPILLDIMVDAGFDAYISDCDKDPIKMFPS